MKKLLIAIILLISALAAFAIAAPADMKRGPAHQYRKGELLVKFKPGVPAKKQAVQALSVGAETIRTFQDIGVQQMRLPEGMSVPEGIRLYQANPDVEYAEPNYVIHADVANVPDDTYFDTLWGLNNTGQTGGTSGADIDAENAWGVQTGSHSVVVAVLDTGIDYNHPDLAANIWHNPGESNCSDGIDNDGNGYKDDCVGWDFVDNDNSPMDLESHGTHVSGTIGAVGNNGEGVTGVNWTVSLMDLRILDANGYGSVADAVAAITYAKKNGAKVVNCSWGGPSYSQSLKDAIDNAPSLLFVCAAGNTGDNTDSVGHYPSGFQSANIISVAATDDTDTVTSWSNYGALSVDLAAPGDFINSTIPGRKDIWSDNFDDGNISDWTTGGTNDTWGLSPVSNTPSYSLADSPGGNYANGTNSWAEAPVLNFSGQSGCLVSYQIRLALATGDKLCVEASGDGSSWTILEGLCWTGNSNGQFFPYTENLTQWDGDSSVYFRFRLQSGSSGTDDGAYIDDMKATCDTTGPGDYTGDEYTHMSGTSMATPHVSGVAALLIANIPSLSALDVKNVLIHTVDTVGVTGPVANWSISNGRINAYNALTVDHASLPPVAPSNLKASVHSKTSVKLTWSDNSNDEDGFRLERKHGSSGSFAVIATPVANTTSYVDSGLTTGVKYTYRILAYNNVTGDSPYSNDASATPRKSSSSSSSTSLIPGCFIATAAYGSPLADDVQLLRDFRDRHLLHNALGRAFVHLYYRYSPPAASVIAHHPALRAATRAALYPLVFSVKYPGGAGLILVLIISAALLAASRRKRRDS